MKRYPHTATIAVVTTTVTGGKVASESTSSQSITGRFEPSEGTKEVKDPDGNYTNLKGKFFTKTEAIAGADKLTVNSEVYRIIRWNEYQSHCELWLD